ncbi:hypothetical protein CERSUDRAFT_96568 [Gelatoporia subvermispora B]|uniref:Uncharacterized protein n=1 Tax=Ceriporiopsis subvermispora (strain B) TaxID=914234 RepID=M2RAK7_CERS8|nr:hypothetical protein CERSUDRAFT_96568 [Gelatoporia subvermispora B]
MAHFTNSQVEATSYPWNNSISGSRPINSGHTQVSQEFSIPNGMIFDPMYYAESAVRGTLDTEHRAHQVSCPPILVLIDPAKAAEARKAFRDRLEQSGNFYVVTEPPLFTTLVINLRCENDTGVSISQFLKEWARPWYKVDGGKHSVSKMFNTLYFTLSVEWPGMKWHVQHLGLHIPRSATLNDLVYRVCELVRRYLMDHMNKAVYDGHQEACRIGARPNATVEDIYVTQLAFGRMCNINYVVPTLAIKRYKGCPW